MSSSSDMHVLIDGDSCPVIPEAIKIAAEFCIVPIVFSDTAHVFQALGAETVTVDKGADSADFAILKKCLKGDLVITGDYALAALCLSKGAFALRQDGTEYTDFNIDMMLESRYINKKIRSSGGKLAKIKKRTDEDDKKFSREMRSLLSRIIKDG